MSLLVDPRGRVLTQARREEHWPPEFMQLLAVFAEAAEHHQLSLFCKDCKEEIHGANAREDNYWRMECACRKYLGKNPLPTAQRRAN